MSINFFKSHNGYVRHLCMAYIDGAREEMLGGKC